MNRRQKKKLENRQEMALGVKVTLTLSENRKASHLSRADRKLFLCDKAHEKITRRKR